MRILLRLPISCLMLGLAVLPAGAEVMIKVLDDGSRVMYNVRSSPRTWRSRPNSSVVARAEIDEFIVAHARNQQLDPDLVKAVVEVESAYRPRAESNKGAMGLMQLMPATAREMSVNDPWDPNENLRGGTMYLRYMLDLFGGQLELALAGYNAGPENVQQYGGIPPFDETRSYVEKVLRIYRNEPGYAISRHQHFARGRKTFLTKDQDGNYRLTTTKEANR